MEAYELLRKEEARKLSKAIEHLEYSYHKIQRLPELTTNYDEETLETWESFAARFSRVADLFLMKYLKTLILINDPGFRGSLRDFLNEAEKLNLITNVNEWLAIRELRNIAAYDYTAKDLAGLFQKLQQHCINLLALKKLLKL